MWFSAEVVRGSFGRLRMNLVEGKIGVERTSALFYFLAFDASHKSQTPLSFDPDTIVGRQNREAFSTEYCKLATLKTLGCGKFLCTEDLGLVTQNGTSPVKRVSSNFLTVPVKKGSQRTLPLDYPKRPLPLLVLGPGLVSSKWGVGAHPDWQVNLHKFLSEKITRTPFTDLAVFVLRDDKLLGDGSFDNALSVGLANRFSTELSDFWSRQVIRESRTFRPNLPAGWRSEVYHDAFSDEAWISSVQRGGSGESSRVEFLENRVIYLEDLLRRNLIPFNGDTTI